MRLVTVAAIALLPLAAAAQSTGDQPAQGYTAEQLVDFYVKSIDLGKPRGICIGSAEQCASPVPEKPAALDMLVNFELDSAQLTEPAKQNLAVFAQMMADRRLKASDFTVEGYTDARGTDQYNDELSRERADAVKAYLIGLGVDPERLTAVGFGKTHPRVEDPMAPENRRVELRIDLGN